MSSLLPLFLLSLASALVMYFTTRGSRGYTADLGRAPGRGSSHDPAGADYDAPLGGLRRRGQIARQIVERRAGNRTPLEGGPR